MYWDLNQVLFCPPGPDFSTHLHANLVDLERILHPVIVRANPSLYTHMCNYLGKATLISAVSRDICTSENVYLFLNPSWRMHGVCVLYMLERERKLTNVLFAYKLIQHKLSEKRSLFNQRNNCISMIVNIGKLSIKTRLFVCVRGLSGHLPPAKVVVYYKNS